MSNARLDRLHLRATFTRTDTARDPEGRPLFRALLTDVTQTDGTSVAKHTWLAWGEQMSKLCLQPGDTVEFVAGVRRTGQAVSLSHPRHMKVEARR